MSTKTRRWAMAILTVVLVLFMGSALAPPAEEDSGVGTTTGTPVPAVISSQPGPTTDAFDRLIHEDEHDHEDDD